ncbi:MAG: hypothetical protein A2X94_04000 [Bdellovibrionales bacterium GWB1_55_8]|nr:MAG: hypothetical protein A2X94_04000 [Bdellovibrionales bacterium GWB1_55_8]
MNDVGEWVLLGKSELADAKRLQSALEERGVRLSLVNDPAACTTKTCKPTVDVFARPMDLPQVREFLDQERTKLYDGLSVDAQLLEEVYDPEKETARCPACGTTFSTQATECPDCGLAFA